MDHDIQTLMLAGQRMGFDLCHSRVAADADLKGLLTKAYLRGIQGLVLMDFEAPILRAEDGWDQFSVVTVRSHRSRLPFHGIEPATFRDTRRAWEYLYQKGYRRIGAALYRHQPNILEDEERAGAILACQHRTPDAAAIPCHELSQDMSADTRFETWLETYRPDAIVGFHVGVLHYLRVHHPERPIAFVCLHLLASGGDYGGITGLRHDLNAVSEHTLFQLDRLIRHGYRGIPERTSITQLEMEWVEGTTA